VDAGISAAGAGYFDRLLEKFLERVLDLARDRATLGLHLKPEERRAVVFNGAANGVL
jgi:hypothetical protein